MKKVFLFLAPTFLVPFLSFSLQAQSSNPDANAAVEKIKANKSPGELKNIVAAASPTAWKLIQERAASGGSLTMADFMALPPNERAALMASIQTLMNAPAPPPASAPTSTRNTPATAGKKFY